MFEDSQLLAEDSSFKKSDIRLLLKAMNAGWEIPDESKKEIVRRLITLAQDEDSRTAVNACNALIKLGLMAQADVHLLLKLKADQDKPPTTQINIGTLSEQDRKIVEGIVDRQFPPALLDAKQVENKEEAGDQPPQF